MSDNAQPVQQTLSQRVSQTSINSKSYDQPLVRTRDLSREFLSGDGVPFSALRGVSLDVPQATTLALVGPSGSGKSTLLNLFGGLDRPTAGSLEVAGLDLIGRSEDELAYHRGKQIGVVFQFFQLLPTLTTLENLMLPMQLVGHIPRAERRERALGLLERFSIADQANKLPSTLSGGQQQRVAIARALANDPSLLIADEPTGNLDTRTAEHVLELMLSLPERGVTLIMATHETRFLPQFERVVTLKDGAIVSDTQRDHNRATSASGSVAC